MKIKKEDFLNKPIYGKNIYLKDDYIYLNDKLKDIIKNITKKFIGLLIGFLFLIVILFLNNYRIKKIEFNANYPINELIEKDIKKETKKILNWRFLTINLNELNYQIRGKYPMYEWIGIEKKNNLVFVSLTDNQTGKKEVISQNKNIIAKKDGVVKEFKVFEGTNMVYQNKAVKKGDVLISNAIEKTRGYILAETYEIETLKIQKKSLNLALTGNISKYMQIDICGLKIKINGGKTYELYEQKETFFFRIKKIFSISNIYLYEKSAIIDMYAKEEAKKLASNYLETIFPKTLEKEEIKEITFLNEQETKEYYILEILVKKLENIGEYEWY